jgi:alkylation response protein AidB-like acyl-CoA dehydrogenase
MTARESSISFVAAAGQIALKLAETVTMRQAPFTDLDLLRRSGLLKFPIPAEDGGPRRCLPDGLEVIRTIASGDGATGQLTGYHRIAGLSQDLRYSVPPDQHFDAQ